jgi:catechol 2,3-dioxygenase-like lactoylglutathione lyase family enzyme
MLKRLDNIGIAVRNARTMHAFYSRIPGFSVPPLDDDATMFSVTVGGLTLFVFQTSARDQTARTDDYLHNPPGLDHLAFEVADIEAAGRQLEQLGIVFLSPAVGAPGEFRYRGFQDPEGNMLYIIQLPG